MEINLDNLSEFGLKRSVLSEKELKELRSEANSLRGSARHSFRPDHSFDADNGVQGRFKVNVSGPGEKLLEFQATSGLELARELLGNDGELYPTRCSYLYYSPGDFALLHHDTAHACITILSGLEGDIEPLVLYPNFGPTSPEDLSILNSIDTYDRDLFHLKSTQYFGKRIRGYEVKFGKNSVVAIRGRHIPHARYLQRAPAMLCATCYALFKPSKDWLTK